MAVANYEEVTYDEVFPYVEPSLSGNSVEDIFGKSEVARVLRCEDSYGDEEEDDADEAAVAGGRLDWMFRRDVQRTPHYRIPNRELNVLDTYSVQVLDIEKDGTVTWMFIDAEAQNTVKRLEAAMKELYPFVLSRYRCLRMRVGEGYINQFVVAKIVDYVIEKPDSCHVRWVRANVLMSLPYRGTVILKDVDDNREYEVPRNRLYCLVSNIGAEKAIVMKGRLEEVARLAHPRILTEVLARFPLVETNMSLQFLGHFDPSSSLPLIRLCNVKDNMAAFYRDFSHYAQKHANYVLDPMVSLFEDGAKCIIADIISPNKLWLCPAPGTWILRVIEERLKAAISALKQICVEYPLQYCDFKAKESFNQIYVFFKQHDEINNFMPRRVKILNVVDQFDVYVRQIDYGLIVKVPISSLQPIIRCDELLSLIPAQSILVKVASPRNDVISGAAIISDGRTLQAQLLEEGENGDPPTVRLLNVEEIYAL